ncbi:MAG TPA: isoamylase [Armatimonadota bacterium]
MGATWVEEDQAYNFALFSRHATGVTLLLFRPEDWERPCHALALDPHRNKTEAVWHCRVPYAEARGAAFYGYRVVGPRRPSDGHRFDPDKLLLDPYARSVIFPPRFSRQAACRAGGNMGRAPVGLLPGREPSPRPVVPRPRHTSDTVIYELHVRGFTRRKCSGVSPEARGTYAGVVEKIPYLKDLGVTAVELLPTHQYDPQEGNYWGYMTLGFFAPHSAYAAGHGYGDEVAEFRWMVEELHRAGIEVLLDVVYNHTTEYDESGPTYSFRGIDNLSYYLLEEDRTRYRNDAGAGNVMHCAHDYVRKLIVDSMHYWVRDMGVDGFRFDLASLLTRNSDGSVNLEDPAIFAEIGSHSDIADTRLIAEAWDAASYQLGRSFPGATWLQWNGQYRDDLRAFLRGDKGMVDRVITRLYGSDDLFPDDLRHAYHAYQSVNYVTSHDGFCLADLVSYSQKRNEANGHGSADGTDHNLSWNCGWEGSHGAPPSVVALRKQQIRNFLCLLMLSNGIPMFCAGDEFMNTQEGNNNPYNQDNETTWLDWALLERNADLHRFVRLMIAFRKAHPSLCRSRFWRDDVRWYGVGPQVDRGQDSHSLAFFLQGASQGDRSLYVMVNAYWEALTFRIQEGKPEDWVRVVDTSLPSPSDIADPGQETALWSLNYTVAARSTVVLMER